MALLEIYDMAHWALNRSRHVYIISFDVSGAFDNVSHIKIMRALKEFEINGRIRRVLHGWLRGKTFQEKMRTAMGTLFSDVHTISRGLPQGGVMSPLHWTLFFNEVPALLEKEREKNGLPLGDFKDVIYADDVTTVVLADSMDELVARANLTMQMMRRVMDLMHLSINELKTQNMMLDPKVLPWGGVPAPAWIYLYGYPRASQTTILPRGDTR